MFETLVVNEPANSQDNPWPVKAAKPGYLREVLIEGSKKARVVAQATMERVRDAVKLKY